MIWVIDRLRRMRRIPVKVIVMLEFKCVLVRVALAIQHVYDEAGRVDFRVCCCTPSVLQASDLYPHAGPVP